MIAAVTAAVVLVLLVGYRAAPTLKAVEVDAEPVMEEHASLLRIWRLPLGVLVGCAAWAFLGGFVGAVGGVAVAVVAWKILGAVESPDAKKRRVELERDLPVAVHLLGAALASGSSSTTAVLDVAEALPGAIADELRRTYHRLLLGVDPVTVWRTVDGALQPLGRTLVRAHESGASVRGAVERLSEDLRAGSQQRAEAIARTVEVRASAPLGACFLPAFVVLGIVPMTVGIFSTLDLFG
ncbi:Flp pilus assembly protein TadB [Marmoricola sp. OAE513]|uniref:type II secretion system F family protein n=1 Tax=Marmoricola sp. OAE513 TaxID=2817894 RepID=UPI001AE43DE5